MTVKKVGNWIRHRIEMVPAAARFELAHSPDTGEESSILGKFEATSGESSHERARELSELIYEQAEEHSQAYEGRQRYKLHAYSRDEDEVGVYVFAIGLSGMARAEPGEPSERGLLAQLMRHNQMLAQINVEQSQAVNSALIAENRDLRSRVDRVEGQRQEWFELLENLHSERHLREMEMLQQSQAAENKAKVVSILARYIPEAMKQIGGGSRSPGSPKQETKQLAPAKSDPLADAHDKMRRVWRLLDRDWIAGHLDEQNRERVDRLLGIGEPIASLEDFADTLRALWLSLADDVTEQIQTTIFAKDAALAVELLGLLGDDDNKDEAAE